MPSAALTQIERRLTELACPSGQLRRKVRELAEHHDDLKYDALEEGLSETEAEARADELLGEPVVLAEHLAAALRQSSWWGRHPLIGFCLLPPLAIIPLLLLGLWLEYVLARLYFTQEQIGTLSEWETGLEYCRFGVLATYYAAIVSTAFLFSALARRVVTGFKWAFAACFMCALHGAFSFVTLASHNITFGFINQIHWLGALLPLLVAGVIWFKLRRAANQLAPLPPRSGSSRTAAFALPQIPKSGLVTPTSVITLLIITAIIVLIYRAHIPINYHKETVPAVKAAPLQPSPGKKPATPVRL